MWGEMTRREWLEWQVFLALEPLPGPRMDVHHAVLLRDLRNYMRDPKAHPQPFTLEDCLMRFGDDLPPAPTRKQTWQEQKALMMQYVQEFAKEAK